MVTLSNVTQAFQPSYNKNHNILGGLHIECGLLRKWRQYQTAQLRCSIDQSVRIDWDLNTALLTNNILKGTTCYQTKDQKTSKKWKTPGFLFWNKLKRLGFGVEASRTKTQTNQEPGKTLSYFQIYFIHVLARLFDRPSLFKTFLLLCVSFKVALPLIVTFSWAPSSFHTM